ncbi:cation transporter [Brevundimonas sp. S30B]|uniref:cation diffusion facilitator family transporter n=1 Tax=unclassified Brevundimonas TaxID=2622653 RepID=UPI0010722AA7|nr:MULTISPECIES: cation diffusion facilitator family transporter [unclassified Brevundimonas]QBX36428.1 cation transporter [Brevundimonas sp. MF30-B]TFW00680.1 cation transporter [Brevundimonas sp. S30B]
MSTPASDTPPPAPDTPVDSLAAGRLATRRITRISVAVALGLILLKTFALGASGSVAVLASLADSALDLFASLATFFAVRWAAAPPDEQHRYGRGKGEAMAALVQAGLVFASAIFIGWEAVQRIADPRPVTSGGWAVGVMVIAIGVTAWLVWMQTRAIKASGSLAVTGDRAHYSADLAANVVVLIGLVSGAYLGAPGLDAAAGLIVAVWLFWGALGVLRPAADQLLDRAAPAEDRAAVAQAVLADPRVGGVHQLRARRSGPVLIVQMHVDLDPALTLEQAHAIVVEAEGRIAERFPGADILIHADPRGGVSREAHAPIPASAPAPSGPWS